MDYLVAQINAHNSLNPEKSKTEPKSSIVQLPKKNQEYLLWTVFVLSFVSQKMLSTKRKLTPSCRGKNHTTDKLPMLYDLVHFEKCRNLTFAMAKFEFVLPF